jgi:hypothetical protein
MVSFLKQSEQVGMIMKSHRNCEEEFKYNYIFINKIYHRHHQQSAIILLLTINAAENSTIYLYFKYIKLSPKASSLWEILG